MAWTTPTTRTKGDLITAAIWNVAVNNDIDMHSQQISAAMVAINGNQAVNSGDDVAWATETLDNDGYHAPAANTKLTAPYDGIYMIDLYVVSSGATAFTIRLNDTSTLVDLGTVTTLVKSAVINLSANDFITLRIGTDSKTLTDGGEFAIKLLAKV